MITVKVKDVSPIPRGFQLATANLPGTSLGYRMQLAAEIAAEARQLVPIDTGALRKTIRVLSEGDAAVVMVGNDDVDYGLFNELGTIKMRARPFLRPAADRVMPGFGWGNWEGALLHGFEAPGKNGVDTGESGGYYYSWLRGDMQYPW